MIKIKREDIAYGTIEQLLIVVQLVGVTTVSLNVLPTEEYALWGIFLAIQTLCSFLDAGFGGAIVRYTTYAYSGAKTLPVQGVPDIEADAEPNYLLLLELIHVAKRICRWFALGVIVILVFLSPFINHLSYGIIDSRTMLISWMLFSVAVAVDVYFTYFRNYMKGVGLVTATAKINIVSFFVYSALVILLLLNGWGLLGLSISYLIRTILIRVGMGIYTRNFFANKKNTYQDMKRVAKNSKNSIKIRTLWENSKQLTAVSLCNFASQRGKILIASVFFPLHIIAMLNITTTLTDVLVNFATLPLRTLGIKFSETVPKGKVSESKNIFSFTFLFAVISIMLGSVVIILLGPLALTWIDAQTQLLAPKYIVLLSLYQIAMTAINGSIKYIKSKNIQPFVMSYIVTSLLGIVVTIPFLALGFGLSFYLAVALFSQLVYNAWKWPMYVIKDLNLSFKEMFRRAFHYGLLVITGKN